MRDEASEGVNDDEAVVVEIWMSDLHAADEDLGRSVVIVSGGSSSDGEAFARG